MASSIPPVGALVRDWRQRRRRSQLDLALDAEVTQKHLSFVETGRAAPSRALLLRLAEQLDVPLRERNRLLLAAGYAPVFPERPLGDPLLAPVRAAIGQILRGHLPFPALTVDRHWQLAEANAAVPPLLAGIARPALLEPPVNVLWLSLHPEGLAPRIGNLGVWRASILDRLRREAMVSGDPALIELARELGSYPVADAEREAAPDPSGVVVPLLLAAPDGTMLSLIGTTTVFGTARDLTVAELTLEAFFPADPRTAEALRRLTAA